MIDRIISKLAVCRLIELYVEKYGAFPQMKSGGKAVVKMELHACLGINYLAFSNAIDRALVALGLNKKQTEIVLSPLEIAREIDLEKEARAKSAVVKAGKDPGQEAAAGGPGLTQEGRSAAGPGGDEAQDGPDPGGNGQGDGKQASGIDGEGRSPDDETRDMDADQGGEG